MSFGWPLISLLGAPLFIQRVTCRTSVASGNPGLRSAHSQTVRSRQPRSQRSCSFLISRAWFEAIFTCQNSALDSGSLNNGQSCPCQKQPWTCMTAPYRVSLMSGRPGSEGSCRANRNPARWRRDRRRSSGAVSLPRMPDIIRLRVALSTTSANGQSGE